MRKAAKVKDMLGKYVLYKAKDMADAKKYVERNIPNALRKMVHYDSE